MKNNILKILIPTIILSLGMMSMAHADIYINVMAVNGADAPMRTIRSPDKFCPAVGDFSQPNRAQENSIATHIGRIK